jgi:glycine cleavage system transcriptional repressor
MPELVMTAVGLDRPGLVGELTEHLFAAGVNLADSRMVNLRGQFALLVLLEGTDAALAQVRATLPAEAQKLGMAVSFAPQATAAGARPGVPYRLKTYSLDQPGIVYRMTTTLKRYEVNIEEMETRLESGPFMGSPLFTMSMRLSVPPAVQIRELRAALEDIAGIFNCSMDLEPA